MLPRSSIDDSRLATTFCLASCTAPVDSVSVAITGKASGTTAIARAMTNSSRLGRCVKSRVSSSLARNVRPRVMSATHSNRLLNDCRDFSYWVILCVRVDSEAMVPSSVALPVAYTTPVASPLWTILPVNNSEPSPLAAASLATGSDSPVNWDSSTWTLRALSSLQSAGTMSPSLRMTMSPGTSRASSSRAVFPSRLVAICLLMKEESRATACSDRYS